MSSMLHGVLFDFSGTLFHTESLFHAVTRRVFEASQPGEIDIDELRAHSGLAFQDRFEYMLTNRGIDDDALVEQLATKAEQQFNEEYSAHGALVAGAAELIARLQSAGVALGVVSSARSTYILSELQKVSLHTVFNAIIGSDSVQITKPHPEPYMKALEELQLEAQHVVAFEDSPTGIESATLAGIKTVGLLTTFEPSDLTKAERTIHDYTDLEINDIEQIITSV